MAEGMTNAEFNAFLETLAQLIEAKAATPEEGEGQIKAGLRNPYQSEPQTQTTKASGEPYPRRLDCNPCKAKNQGGNQHDDFFLLCYRHRRRVAGLRRGPAGGMDRR